MASGNEICFCKQMSMCGMRLNTVDLSCMSIQDLFWKKHTDLVEKVIIPYQWEIMNDRIKGVESSHCLDNFRIAAGKKKGNFYGAVFQDTDIAKWLEAVGYSLAEKKNEALETLADQVIDLLLEAQQPDGYIDTYYIIKEPGLRWTNLCEGHELYGAGHMIEAAIAYAQGTGKKKFLEGMIRLADLICETFGKGEGQNHGYPGHQEIELALLRLAKITGEKKYAKQAKYFLDIRGVGKNYFQEERKKVSFRQIFTDLADYDPMYSQSHLPVSRQKTAEGHAVRAVYMYAAMADAAYEFSDKAMMEACRRLWNNIVEKRMYITGGIGSSGFLERFTTDYDLPNDCNYSETCASIGMALFGIRMANLEKDSRYADIVELELYNNILAGIALDGKSFFYVNPLEVKPQNCMSHTSRAHVRATRQKWFGVACCPPNIARTLASLGQYIYGISEEEIYVHLYIGSEVRSRFAEKGLEIQMESHMPWEGNIELSLRGVGKGRRVGLRMPEYAKQFQVYLDGKRISYEVQRGYAMLTIDDQAKITVCFDMEAVFLHANSQVSADVGKTALKRGPIVYCLEEVDNGKNLSCCYVNVQEPVKVMKYPELGNCRKLQMKGWKLKDPDESLYHSGSPSFEEQTFTAIPYAYWNNRGEGEMLVWMHSVFWS